MSHVRIPDFSTRLPVSTIEHAPDFADPILAAIERHAEAWAVFQVAPEGDASLAAEENMEAALSALLAVSCATRFGGIALLRHLRWWLGEEAEFSASYQPEYSVAQARADDLTLFLGSDITALAAPVATRLGVPAARVVRPLAVAKKRQDRGLYVHLRRIRDPRPDEDQPGSIEPWEAVCAVRPDTAHVRAPRLIDGLGEAFAALSLICGGALLIGLATLA